jgi:hypothetical protein
VIKDAIVSVSGGEPRFLEGPTDGLESISLDELKKRIYS